MANTSGHSPHISDLDLIRFADGETPVTFVPATETHLRTCDKCRTRLDQLRSGAEAYQKYHAHHLKPTLPLPEEWSSLRDRLENLEKGRNQFFVPVAAWWTAAALACCGVVVGWFVHSDAPTRRMEQVLVKAVLVRTPPHGRLQVTSNGHSWYRAAEFREGDSSGLENTRELFVKANYSWDDPLSARSFAAWRKHLANKRDQVLSVEGLNGKNRFYRLQTETSDGVLRTAALTLRADTLNPVKGAFHFEGNDDVVIDAAGEMPEPSAEREAKPSQAVQQRTMTKEVGPEEELRVFAALNAIGADVGEPVTVDFDSSRRQIVVAGLGLSPDREWQIRQALAPIPSTAIRFTSGQPAGVENQPAKAGDYVSENAAPLRHTLETQAGGAEQFQLIADKALDASSTILAQAHALFVLSQKFPASVTSAFGSPELETLRSLRSRHALAIERATAGLEDALRPILSSSTATPDETQGQPATSWEPGAAQLYESAKLLDASLGRLLAGTYSQEAGQSIWNKLPDEIQKLELLARSQQNVR